MSFVTADRSSLETNLVKLIEDQLDTYLLSFERIDGLFILADRSKRLRTITFHVEKDYSERSTSKQADNFMKLPKQYLTHVKDALVDRIDTFFACLLNDPSSRIYLTSYMYIRLNNCSSESSSSENWMDLLIREDNRNIEKISLPKPDNYENKLENSSTTQVEDENVTKEDDSYDDIIVLEGPPKKTEMIYICDEENHHTNVYNSSIENEF
ncbi:unnamed protein product [Dimorphilus gyrociliatus]|uniref:Uncharacterized protein n=1 Tax=Dimorphilus gyrociliatus TaxID=2664684 RepID=A0A7I8VJ91_9ANNE|nr:unnamed protein product [Dimorphilus gyrociliatus]